MGKFYQTQKVPIVVGEIVADKIKVWAPAPFDSTDHSRLWLVEKLKDGSPHIWRACDINRLRRGLTPKVNKCEMWYRHGDPKAEQERQMETYFKPAMKWAAETLSKLKPVSQVAAFSASHLIDMAEDINKIAEEARRALDGIADANTKHGKLVEQRNEAVRPLLKRVHDAIVVGKQEVEGCKSWTAWAKKAGWSKRALDFILNGRPERKGGNPGSRLPVLKVGMKFVDERNDQVYVVQDFYSRDSKDNEKGHGKITLTVVPEEVWDETLAEKNVPTPTRKQIKKAVEKKSEKKVHAPWYSHSDHKLLGTQCSMDASYPMSENADEVTCGNCKSKMDAERHAALGAAPTAPAQKPAEAGAVHLYVYDAHNETACGSANGTTASAQSGHVTCEACKPAVEEELRRQNEKLRRKKEKRSEAAKKAAATRKRKKEENTVALVLAKD